MKKILFFFFLLFLFSSNFFSKAIDLPKYYKFPENYLKGDFYNSTKNFLLVATEDMTDSRFKETVIVMLDHDKKGALGIVVNKPIRTINIGSLIEDLVNKKINDKKIYNFKIPIYWGGPLDTDKILILHSDDYKNNNTTTYKNISITNDYKTLIDIAEQKGPKNSLVVIGISAWNIGQLDGEIEKGHWNLSEVKDEIIFKKNNKDKFILATENSFIRL